MLAEYTTTKNDISEHLKKKKVLYDKIKADPEGFLKFLEATFSEFGSAKSKKYLPEHFRFAIVYCSLWPVKKELKNDVPAIVYMDHHIVKYFKAITDRVKQSARFELMAFLGFKHFEIGDNVISSAASVSVSYKGSILPEGQSHFPKGYKVISFYVDPGTLLERCYVLRKDGWSEDAGLYQRMIRKTKIESIRKYLLSKKRVFINNVIVTLPSGTHITEDSGKTLDHAKITKTEPVIIQLPDEYNSIGLIDGQHRIFSYYQGGANESDIAILRSQQNLLVTGIMYPSNLSQAERSKFEATLFLEINATQTNAKSDLKQAIGLLLQPYSQDSIARQVVNRLNETGPLSGEIERYFFDNSKLKVTSIVSYGVKPIVKFAGNDTLFRAWKNLQKNELVKAQQTGQGTPEAEKLLQEYITFCAREINIFINAVKSNVAGEKWTADNSVEGKLLTTTTINGFIVCLRYLIENQKLLTFDNYKTKLAEIEKFGFRKYRSSQYGRMGEDMYKKYLGT